MCAICGFVHRHRERPVDRAKLIAMRDSMVHRGPDDSGLYIDKGVGLASRRLAILDLSSRGHMPMSTPDGRYHIVYNGEVYNFEELRESLLSDRDLVSDTDTEVVLHLYAKYGPDMLKRLNGMFGIAIWDSVDRELFLARDRLGVKPLYYTFDDDTFFFASEQKAICAAGVDTSFDPETWEELLCFRHVAGERTPLSGIQRLLPGRYLIWKDGSTEIRRWWQHPRTGATDESGINSELWFQQTFDDAVRLRLISNVPVGVLLSGGLDSSSVAMSLARQHDERLKTYTIRFREQSYDEGPLARQVAEAGKLEYNELFVDDRSLLGYLRRASRLCDEPLSHANTLQLLAISEFAKSNVTVLLSGEGADETLGGYVRYQPLRYLSLLRKGRRLLDVAVEQFGMRGRYAKLAKFMELGSDQAFVMYNAADLFPDDLRILGLDPQRSFPYREEVLSEAMSYYPDEPFRQAMLSDQQTFLCSILDRNDRMTMGASIECRVPFLDYRLVEGLAAMPSSALLSRFKSKALLRNSVGDRLPPAIQRRKKWGFGVPWHMHLREVPELRELVQNLPDSEPIRSGPFSRKRVQQVVSEFLQSPALHNALILQLVLVAVWHESYFEQKTSAAISVS
jgi:asparagine synthase (glutamine-hydrolysing)